MHVEITAEAYHNTCGKRCEMFFEVELMSFVCSTYENESIHTKLYLVQTTCRPAAFMSNLSRCYAGTPEIINA